MPRLFQYEVFFLSSSDSTVLPTSSEGSKSKLHPHFIARDADIEVKPPARPREHHRKENGDTNQEMEREAMKSCHADVASVLKP